MKSIVALLCLASATLPLLADQIIYVNQNAPANSAQSGTSWANAFTSLQDALASAQNAQPTAASPVAIWVATGTYVPTTNFDRGMSFFMFDNLRILGGFRGTESSDTQRMYSNVV